MACNLKISTSPTVDFEGPAGASVTLKLTSPDNVDAKIVHVRYAKNGIAQPPFNFTLTAGTNLLVVIAEDTKPGALLQLREDCGDGTDNMLTTFHYDPFNPARGYFIQS